MKQPYIDPDILSSSINTGIQKQIGLYYSDLLINSQKKLQQLRNSWKKEQWKTLVCPTKDNTCVNQLVPPVMKTGKNGLPHECFNYIQIKINDTQYHIYITKYHSWW